MTDQEILTKEYIEPFQQWLLGDGRSANTIKAYSTDVRMFLQESRLNSLTADHLPSQVATWLNEKKRIVSPNTSRRRLASLREFSKFMGLTSMLSGFRVPSAGQAIPHPLPNGEVDLQNMLNACRNNKQRCLIALLGLEGLRLSEALDLEFKNFDLEDMTIAVWGKGSKERTIPITKRAWTYITPQLIDTVAEGAKKVIPYSDRGARYFITELGYTANVNRSVASHDLRATFATLAYQESGHDIRTVQMWLGHADISTTQGYVKVDMDKMRAAGEF